MQRFFVTLAIGSMLVVGGLAATAQTSRQTVSVFKDPTCGCCTKWVEHLKQNGFATKTTESTDMDSVKAQHRVPRQTRSCHTALVGGYAIEGHVPAADIQRLLKDRPASVIGLAVPGMPIGSPGMEVTGQKAQAFDVLAFDKAGKTRVFASHR